jgi:hypothetical protein
MRNKKQLTKNIVPPLPFDNDAIQTEQKLLQQRTNVLKMQRTTRNVFQRSLVQRTYIGTDMQNYNA